MSHFDQDFNPTVPRAAGGEAMRMANAADYSAYQLGKISRNLERLIAILEKGQKA